MTASDAPDRAREPDCFRLEATEAEAAVLWQSARRLRHLLGSRFPEARLVAAGSLTQAHALTPRLAGQLDLDLFLLLPPWALPDYGSTFGSLDDLLARICARRGWRCIATPHHYRIYVQDHPSAYLDLTPAFSSNGRTVRVHRYDGTATETSTPGRSPAALPHGPLQPRRSLILNVKLWAKCFLPYELRPASVVLRAMLDRHWLAGDTPWESLRRTITNLVTRLSGGRGLVLLPGHRAAVPILSTTSNLQRFVLRLTTLADLLHRMTPAEWRRHLVEGAAVASPVRVFVSSRQKELAALRSALAGNVPRDIQFLLAEQFFDWSGGQGDGMSVCESVLESADLFVGIYDREYGSPARMRRASPIEEEYDAATSRLGAARLLLFEHSRPRGQRDPQLVRFLDRARDRHSVNPMSWDVELAARQVVDAVQRSV